MKKRRKVTKTTKSRPTYNNCSCHCNLLFSIFLDLFLIVVFYKISLKYSLNKKKANPFQCKTIPVWKHPAKFCQQIRKISWSFVCKSWILRITNQKPCTWLQKEQYLFNCFGALLIYILNFKEIRPFDRYFFEKTRQNVPSFPV